MDYIKVSHYQLQVVYDFQVDWVDRPFTSYLNEILRPYLTTLKTQEKILKKIFGFKNKLPILVNRNCLFLCMTSYRCHQAFYINYCQILSWEKDGKGVLISFINDHVMRLHSYQSFINQIKKIEQILSNQDKIKIIQG